MKICYTPKNFRSDTLRLITQCNDIIHEYREQGFDLTVRQLFYQFVSRDWFPEDRKWAQRGNKWVRDPNGTKNAEPNYKWLGGVVSDARLSGMIDWNSMVDRTRILHEHPAWDTPADIIKSAANSFAVDMWENQEFRPEVWIEKDALLGVIEPICTQYSIPFFSCRGYTSQSAMWRAARRLQKYDTKGYTPIIIHLGDHDPSGVDMSRDIVDRIQETFNVDIDFERIALTMSQVEQYDPPPNPAKITDSRAGKYIDIYGDKSWELDALEPQVMAELIKGQVVDLIDFDQWDKDTKRKEDGIANLLEVSRNWSKVVETFGLNS